MRGDSLVGRGHNKATSDHDPTAHAETDALRNAGASARQVDFSSCTLYTTFEPCPMCCGAIMSSRISTLVMGARPDPAEDRWGSYTVEALIKMAGHGGSIEVVTGILPQECHAVRAEWEG